MANNEHVAMLARGAAAWNERRADRDETSDLSRAGLRGLDFSGFDLLRGRSSGRRLQRNKTLRRGSLRCPSGVNLFKAVVDGANLSRAFLTEAQFLNCAQLVVTRNWQSAFRDETLGCGASIPNKNPSE